MAANNILPFAQGGGANVQTQSDYLADAQRLTGNQPGTARSAFVNKALLQLSAVAVGVAQFLADYQGTDVGDGLSGASLSTMMKNALNTTGLFTTQAAGNNSTRPATTAYVDAAVGSAQTVGQVAYYPASAAPTGWLKMNGALVARASYPALWSYAQTSGNIAASDGAWIKGQFSPGDGSTTFRIPDVRGYHLRALDDGAGIDGGRGLGSVQADAVLSHNHPISVSAADLGHVHDTTIRVFNPGGSDNSNYGSQTGTPIYTGLGYASISASGTSAAVGAAENRVKNIAFLGCIKF